MDRVSEAEVWVSSADQAYISGGTSGRYSALVDAESALFLERNERLGKRETSLVARNEDLLQVVELGLYAAGVTDDARTTGDQEEDADELLMKTWARRVRWDRRVRVVVVDCCGKRK